MILLTKLGITTWLCTAALWDVRTATIPNWLTLPMMAAVGGWRLYQWSWNVLLIWAMLYLVWRANILGGGDTKLLMGLFALFPTLDFALIFSAVVLIVSVPLIVARHWGKHPADILWAIVDRVQAGRLLPSREELEEHGQSYAWTFCLPGVIYLWLLW